MIVSALLRCMEVVYSGIRRFVGPFPVQASTNLVTKKTATNYEIIKDDKRFAERFM